MIEIQWHPDRRFLRQFAALLIVFFGIAGALQYFGRGATTAGIVLWAVGAVLGSLGLVLPAAARAIYLAWMCALFPIAWVVWHVLLALVYYLVFTPIGVVMRLCGRDPLERTFLREAPTYWKRRPAQDGGVERYFRQF